MFVPPKRLASALAALSLMLGADVCFAEDEGEVKWEVTSDLDGDGTLDRASLLDAGDGATTDLHIFLGIGDAEPRADARPDIVKKAVAPGTILAFESREKGTLSVTSCTSCTSMSYLNETLTMVYQHRRLMVGGFTRGWELSHRLANGNVDVTMGGCSIDFLTGEGRVSKGLDGERPVRKRFPPVALADWSEKRYPAICKYEGEE